jgi:hydrogenase maturation protein HypF
VIRRVRIDVRGAVQGVGFRPFVYQCATRLGLAGWVENTTFGVRVEAEGEAEGISALLHALEGSPPPNASIVSVEVEELAPRAENAFVIKTSASQGARVAQILPDLATCEDCLGELFEPKDRRYLYPFINCTHCGPRYSIVEDVPYDRARTSMRYFPMCPACRAEYEDPSNAASTPSLTPVRSADRASPYGTAVAQSWRRTMTHCLGPRRRSAWEKSLPRKASAGSI